MSLYNSYTDEDLLTLLKQGDREAFAEIFERYSDLLYSHAFNKLRHKEDAQDVVQTVFVKLWNKRRQVDIGDNLPGYLYTIVRNHIFSLIAHKNVVTRYANSFRSFKQEGEAITDYRVREKIFSMLIENEIAALPPRMRKVFELSRKENLTHKQIAARLGISELTVADQIKKALKQLRSRIGMMLILLGYL